VKRYISALLLSSSLLLAGEDLKMLLDAAHQNDLVEAYVQQTRSARLEYRSARSSYLPRVDLGASATLVDEKGSIDVGETYNAYAKASLTLFDGFKRENILDEKRSRIHASESDLEAYRKSLSLEVAQNYFNLLNLYGDIDAQLQNRKQLQEQLRRQERFLEARIVTAEEVERIKAALANADYQIEQLRYSAEALEYALHTLTGIVIDELLPSRIAEPGSLKTSEPDAIRALRYQAQATGYSAKQSNPAFYPTISVEDTYGFYEYRDEPTGFPIDRAEKQNRFMAVLSLNLLDFSSASEREQALMAQKNALESQIAYEQKRADADVQLSRKAITRAKALIAAAELALSASQKTYDAVEKKYNARIVDYVKFLDALYQKTDALAQYNRAKNTLQSAYAHYYYHAGYDLKEYVQ
jgi:outer membrane protein